jgi:SAM-dependent methyltransferase
VYGEDLAWIHHVGFSELADAVALEYGDYFRKKSGDSRRRTPDIVDVGCGSGVLARQLTRAGFSVFGIDASPAMIALARQNAPEARFEVGTFADAELPPCGMITAIGEVLNYGHRDELPSFFHRAAASASTLLFDIAECGSYPAHDERRIGGEDWSVIAIKESDGLRITRRVLTFRQIGSETRRSEEVHELELYDRDDVTRMLREAGFRVRIRRSYGAYRLPRGHAVYLAIQKER